MTQKPRREEVRVEMQLLIKGYWVLIVLDGVWVSDIEGQTEESARTRPGQIRRPKPKLYFRGSGLGGFDWWRKRAGLKVKGSG